MQAGYPRFFCHPTVVALFSRARAEVAGPSQRVLVFPSEAAWAGCAEFMESRRVGAVASARIGPATIAIFDQAAEKTARLYWRFCGQVVSSRLAAAILEDWSPERFAEAERAGEHARTAIRQRLSELSGQPGENIFLFASGMAGNFAVQRGFSALKPAAKTVQFGFPYVDVLKIQQEFGAGAHLVPGVGSSEMARFRAIVAAEPVAGLFCEFPSNPLIESADLIRLAGIAREHEIPVCVDDTVATVVNVDVMAHADVVTTSLTKAFCGVGDVMAGAVIVNERSPWRDPLRATLDAHQRAAPLFGPDALVLEKNSRDFPERVHRMSESAAALAGFLASHRAVRRVHFPTEDRSGLYDALRRPGHGYGMLLSLTLDDPKSTPAFFDQLRVSKGPSLGTNFSLACPYTLLAHYSELDWAEACGVSRDLVRVSVGLEPPDDLISRFESALPRF